MGISDGPGQPGEEVLVFDVLADVDLYDLEGIVERRVYVVIAREKPVKDMAPGAPVSARDDEDLFMFVDGDGLRHSQAIQGI